MPLGSGGQMQAHSGESRETNGMPHVGKNLAPPGYLSLPMAAAFVSVSSRTVKRWIAQGLPMYQAGPRTKVLIRPSDIEQFLTRQQAPRPALDRMVAEVMQGLQGGRSIRMGQR